MIIDSIRVGRPLEGAYKYLILIEQLMTQCEVVCWLIIFLKIVCVKNFTQIL